MRLSDFLDDVGRPVAYFPKLALCLGNVNATILLCQLFYWEGKQDDQVEGWIYKTQREICEETGLSRRESDTARKVLRKKKIITDKLRGVPPKIHFLLHRKPLDDLWDEWRKSSNQGGGKRQTNLAESAKSDGGKRRIDSAVNAESKRPDAPNRFGGVRHDIDTETTPETTSETTREDTHTGAPPPGAKSRARARVSVGSRFGLKERKRWARWKASLPGSSLRDPEAVARARGDGLDDEEIEEFLAMEERLPPESDVGLPLFGGEPAAEWPAPPPPEGREEEAAAAWRDIAERLRGAVARQSFETWIAPLQPVSIREGVLLLHAPHAVACDWVGHNYGDALAGAVAAAGGRHGVRGVAFMRPETGDKKGASV